MTCVYDKDVFELFKYLAVSNVEDLVVGETYYTNYGDTPEFTVKKIVSTGEFDMMRGFSNYDETDTTPRWIVFGDDEYDYISLADYNVTASYNPWLIFKDREIRDICLDNLIINIERNPHEVDWENLWVEESLKEKQ